MEKDTNNVILAALKLSRAMRRCPPPFTEQPFPPAISRLLSCVAENPCVSSRDLCEILDLRPSSLSEMLARAENDGWITRAPDETDRRMQRVNLSAKGRAFLSRMEEAWQEDLARKASCFSEEEKAQFCALSNRLSEHLESMASGFPPHMPRPGASGKPRFPGGRDDPLPPPPPGFPPSPFREPPEAPGTPAESGAPDEAENPSARRLMEKGRIRC